MKIKDFDVIIKTNYLYRVKAKNSKEAIEKVNNWEAGEGELNSRITKVYRV